MAKRKLELDVCDISEVGENTSVTVHGALLEMSPVKTSRKNAGVKYLEGRVTDGKDVCRFVSFSPAKVKEEWEGVKEKGGGSGLSLVNCDIKKSRFGSGYELVLSEKSCIMCSPKRFRVDDEIQSKLNSVCELRELAEINGVAAQVGNKVCVRGKVVSMKEMDEIKSVKGDGGVFKKQECVLADKSQACRLVLWENLINTVEDGKSYKMSSVSVKSYNGDKYLSTLDASEIMEVPDIGEVCASSIVVGQKECVVGEIIGVVSYNRFCGCLSCGAKVGFLGSRQIGTCEKCGLKQKKEKCKKNVAARVMLVDGEGKKRIVSMFGEIVRLLESEVVVDDNDDDDVDLEMKLLNVGLKKFEINLQNIVTRVENVD